MGDLNFLFRDCSIVFAVFSIKYSKVLALSLAQ